MASHTLSKILMHVVFSTKSKSILIPKNRLYDLHAYVSKIIAFNGAKAYKVGGVSDHVHIAMSLSRTMTIAKTIERIKVASSKWMKEDGQDIRDFKWQKGYGIFSLGESQLPNLIRYINNQENHHKIKTYEEELQHIYNMYHIDSNNLDYVLS